MLRPFHFLAQIDLSNASPDTPAWDGGGYSVLVLTLVLMIGALSAAYLYLRRFGTPRQGGKGRLEILETRPLGGRQFLLVGRYGSETFLLGVCPGRIDYLSRLEAAGFDSLLEAEGAPPATGKG